MEAAGRRQSRLGCGGGEDELQQAVVIRWRRQWTVSGLPLLGREDKLISTLYIFHM